MIVIIHDFVDALANQSQPKKGGEDEEHHEEAGVCILHRLFFQIILGPFSGAFFN